MILTKILLYFISFVMDLQKVLTFQFCIKGIFKNMISMQTLSLYMAYWYYLESNS